MRWRMLLADVPGYVAERLTWWAVGIAVDRGRRAALSGKGREANPYPRDRVPHLRAAWDRGYRSGVVELAGDR